MPELPHGGTDVGSPDELSTGDLSRLAMPETRFERAMQWVPRTLASKPHVVFLIGLGIYLVVLPLFGIMVSAKAELIGGNYTNVTGDVGAWTDVAGLGPRRRSKPSDTPTQGTKTQTCPSAPGCSTVDC